MELRCCSCLEEIRNNKSVRLSFCCLYDDIIVEILAKLPVKILSKFKCVSKSWCRLISSKRFIETHLENSKKNTDLSRHGVIFTSYERWYSVWSLHSSSYERIAEAVELDSSRNIYPKDKSGVDILGSCNGLCCMLKTNPYSFFIWNPSTRKSKKLNDFHIGNYYVKSYGFGFDQSTDDYKVLFVLWGNRAKSIVLKLYSLKANSWKTIEEPIDGSLFGDDMGLFLNGKLHWAGIRSGKRVIMSFDLGSEEQGLIEQPHYVPCKEYDVNLFEPSLEVLDGRLCMLYECERNRVDLWVMKQYGVKESWNKVVCVPYATGDPERDLYSCGFVQDGKMVHFYTWSPLMSHPKTKLLRCPPRDGYAQVLEYTESMVFPFADGDGEGETE